MPEPTINLTALLPQVMPQVTGCPIPVAAHALRQAAIEFCERTRAWREVTTVSVTTNDGIIGAPAYATIHAIEYAQIGHTRLEPMAHVDVDNANLGLSGPPSHITQVSDNRLRLVPFAPCDLIVSAFLKPRQGTAYVAVVGGLPVDSYDVIPEFLYQSHGDVIAQGGLSRLLMRMGAKWANPQLAAYFRGEFLKRTDEVQARSVKGLQRTRLRSKTAWF